MKTQGKTRGEREENKMCDGCLFCDRNNYTVEVTALFLHSVRNAVETLKRISPDDYAPGVGHDIDQAILAIERKYNQRFDLDETIFLEPQLHPIKGRAEKILK